MASNIAKIANHGKREVCDFRGYRTLAISANSRTMEVIDGKWILARLSGRHGEKAEVASYVGISSHKLAKILSGERRVQAEEISRFMAYFGEGAVAPLSEEEKRLIEALRRLEPRERAAILAAAEALRVQGHADEK